MLARIFDFYHFIPPSLILILAGGYKVDTKQNLQLHTFKLNWVKFSIVMEQFKLKILRLNLNEIYWIKGITATLHGRHLDISKLFWFKLDVRIDTTKLYFLILYYMTLTWTQGHWDARKWKLWWQLSPKVMNGFGWNLAYCWDFLSDQSHTLSCPINIYSIMNIIKPNLEKHQSINLRIPANLEFCSQIHPPEGITIEVVVQRKISTKASHSTRMSQQQIKVDADVLKSFEDNEADVLAFWLHFDLCQSHLLWLKNTEFSADYIISRLKNSLHRSSESKPCFIFFFFKQQAKK